MEADFLSAGQPLEIACDESGYEGENLIGGTTDVFAHASVRLRTEAANDCLENIHDQIRSPVQEYKSTHLLRERHRSVLEWFLGPSGPLHGNAHVHLTDKTFFVVGKLIDLLVRRVAHPAGVGPCQDQQAEAMAVTLYREGHRTFGRERWESFLKAFTDMMRARNRRGPETPVDSFFGMVDVLRLASAPGRVGEIIELLRQARPHADALRARLLDTPQAIPALDMLFPAIVQAVVYWSDGGTPVAVTHDEHSALTTERVAQLKDVLSERNQLTSLRRVDSRSDARVQVADFLAGVARRIASDELNDRGDAELTALLSPYTDACSVWGDDRSWSLLRPHAE